RPRRRSKEQDLMAAPLQPVVHLELHTREPERAREFYTGLCGWRAESVDAGGRDYLALRFGDRLGGGIVECAARRALWLPYVEVGEINEATARACRGGAS